MKVRYIKIFGWSDALDAARMTVGKKLLHKEPSDKFKNSILTSEHSPIREARYIIVIDDVPMWVTTHIVRHHEGIEKFVRTQRTDRTGSNIPRNEHKQGELNSIMIDVNAQALINISKVRLCGMASKETKEYWKFVLNAISKVDPIVVKYCVPTCVYRGFCPERKSCGFYKTAKFNEERNLYIRTCLNSVKEEPKKEEKGFFKKIFKRK